MPVEFTGDSPFELPLVQTASAISEGESVAMILNALLPGRGPQPLPMYVQMNWKIALALSEALAKAAIEAELKSR